MNIPNILTWMRIVIIPLLLLLFYLPASAFSMTRINQFATLLFVVAAVTDWLDGYLARRLGQTSAFGAFLDPVADKLIVTAALVILVQIGRVEAWIAMIIIGREIAISALREWMAHIGQTKSMTVSFVGKLKTAVQMLAIVCLLYDSMVLGIHTLAVGYVLILMAAMLTLLSMGYYLRAVAVSFRQEI